MPVDAQLFRALMDLSCLSSSQLAEASGKSPGYVRQVSLGTRKRVQRDFLLRAGNEIGRALAEPGMLAAKLALGGSLEGR